MKESFLALTKRKVIYIILSCILIVGIVYQTLYRHTTVDTLDDVIYGVQDIVQERDAWSDVNEDITGGLNEILFFVSSNYGKSKPFLYGYSLYAMLVNPIPRAVWPGKPQGWGRVLAIEFLFQAPLSEGTSMAAGIGGEAYANGGFVAVVISSMVFGFLFGKMRQGLLTARSLLAASVWLTSLTWIPGLWRGDWLSNVNRLVYCIVSALAVYWSVRVITMSRGAKADKVKVSIEPLITK